MTDTHQIVVGLELLVIPVKRDLHPSYIWVLSFINLKQTKAYREFAENMPNLPLFYQPWWLDAVSAGHSWEGMVFKKGDDVRAIWPVIVKSKLGKKIVFHPALHAYGGVMIFPSNDQKYASRLGMEHEALAYFIRELSSTDLILQKFYPGFENWLPFYWSKFHQRLRYTYTIDLSDSLEFIFGEFRENIRREIRKAEKSMQIIESEEIDDLYALLLHSKEDVLDFSKSHLVRIYEAAQQKKQVYLLRALDEHGNTHGMGMFAQDRNSTYYMLGANDPKFKNTGSMSLLMWSAIQKAKSTSAEFNFEGSMIENVERFFRGFGARQKTFFELKKNKSLMLRAMELLKGQFT